MKSNIITLVAILTTILIGCTSAPDAQKAEASEKKTVNANRASNTGKTVAIKTTASIVNWIGTKPIGQHNGTFNLLNGALIVDNDKLIGGNFVIDISSLKSMDQDDKGNEKLTGHLLSEDFFDAEKYPTAKFEITNAKPIGESKTKYLVTGNLTLKDKTKSVTFACSFNSAGGKYKSSASFNIDRTQWGISYGNDKSLGDRFINPLVNISYSVSSI